MNVKSFISKNPLFKYIFNKWRGTSVSIYKTIIYNFIAFPIKDAIKLPIWIYQGTRIEHIGKIKINAPLKSGMIRFGKRHFFRNTQTCIINNGTMIFNGNCTILGGSIIHVLGVSCKLTIGQEVMIGENTKILVGPDIIIGNYTRLAFNCLVMSADFHYLINISTGEIKKNMAPIDIGDYNWIGNNSIIKKGTITPDFCIVSNNTMLNQDYSKCGIYSFIAGIPGKVCDKKFRRIYNDKHINNIDSYFEKNTDTSIIVPLQDNDPYYEWLCKGKINVHIH